MCTLLNTEPSLLANKTGVGKHILYLYRELKKAGIDAVPTIDSRPRTPVDSLSEISSRLRSFMGTRFADGDRRIPEGVIEYNSLE